MDHAELRRLFEIGFPVVLLHQSAPEGAGFPVVTVENSTGAEMLVHHLIATHGRRRIAFLRGPEGHEDSTWRERGYRRALGPHGIPFGPALLAQGGFDDEESFSSIQEMLLAGIEFDSVFAGNDDSAIGVVRALNLAGHSIPDDVAAVGFDDVPFARSMSPALTTVRPPIEQVGRQAVHQLVCLIDGRPADALTLIPTELIIRASCGCQDSTSGQFPGKR